MCNLHPRRRAERGRAWPCRSCRPPLGSCAPPTLDTLHITTAQNVDLAVATAGLGRRIQAWLVDLAIVVAYLLVTSLAVQPLVGYYWEGAAPLVGVLAFVPVVLYHLVFELLLRGQSPGKRALGLTVVRLDGTPPTPMQFVLRWALRWIDVTLSQGVVAAFSIAVTQHGQRLGDLAAGTTVVRRLPPIALVDVDYPSVGPGYVPQIPEAVRLSDADIRTLRALLLKLRAQPTSEDAQRLVRQAADLVLARVGAHLAWMTPEDLLARVVTDYTVLHDRYA